MQFNPNPTDSAKLITSYTFSGNSQFSISSIDYTSYTLTCSGNGLTSGTALYVMPNYNIGNVYPNNYFPTGLNGMTSYYPVNISSNTFQLSTSSTGNAMTLTSGSQTDLTKWHLENSTTNSLGISNLPPSFRYKIIVYGRSLNSTYMFFQPNGFPYSNVMMTGSSDYNNNPGNSAGGNMLVYREYDVNFSKYAYYKATGFDAWTNSTTSLSTRTVSYSAYCNQMSFYNTKITNFSIYQFAFANGTTMEVYHF